MDNEYMQTAHLDLLYIMTTVDSNFFYLVPAEWFEL